MSCRITTDETLRETQRHGSGDYPFAYYPEDICQFDFCQIDWHWHHELEFMSVTGGTATCLVGTDKIELTRGFGLFVNSGVLHRFESKGSTPIPNIVFAPSLLAPEESLIYKKYIHPVLNSSAAYQIFDPGIEWQNRILRLLEQIYTIQEQEPFRTNPEFREKCGGTGGQDPFPAVKPDCGNELRTLRLILQIWEILFQHLNLAPGSPGQQHINHRQARLRTMMQYIHDHYAEELTLEEIAASAAISKSGALHIFQSFIHLPPVAYLIRYRLTRAAEQLSATEKSVSVIAREAGFENPGYFCRKFRQYYRMSPNEYRRRRA